MPAPRDVSQFEEALLHGGLRELALQMSAAGLRQVEIYHAFSQFRDHLADMGREAAVNAVGEALEMIVGCCATRWFDHYLSNAEIYSFESGIAEEDITRMCDMIHKVSRCWIPCGYVKQSEELVAARVMVLDGGAFVREIRVAFEKDSGDWRLKAEVEG